MLFCELLTDLVELGDEASPSRNYFFIIHPSELHKRERVSECPHEVCDDEVADDDERLLGGLSEGRDGGTNVGQPRFCQILNEKQYVSDALQVFPFRVGSYPH